MSWSARQYSSFEKERTRPVRDLLNAIETTDVKRAIDLGCGPGNSTEVLADRFPAAEVSGLDSSADMIEAARKRLPGLRFDLGGIAIVGRCRAVRRDPGQRGAAMAAGSRVAVASADRQAGAGRQLWRCRCRTTWRNRRTG